MGGEGRMVDGGEMEGETARWERSRPRESAAEINSVRNAKLIKKENFFPNQIHLGNKA